MIRVRHWIALWVARRRRSRALYHYMNIRYDCATQSERGAALLDLIHADRELEGLRSRVL